MNHNIPTVTKPNDGFLNKWEYCDSLDTPVVQNLTVTVQLKAAT
jgi:hypothetical protein